MSAESQASVVPLLQNSRDLLNTTMLQPHAPSPDAQDAAGATGKHKPHSRLQNTPRPASRKAKSPGDRGIRSPLGLPTTPLGHGDHRHHLHKAAVGAESVWCWRCWKKLEGPSSLYITALKTHVEGEFAEVKSPPFTVLVLPPQLPCPRAAPKRAVQFISPSARN